MEWERCLEPLRIGCLDGPRQRVLDLGMAGRVVWKPDGSPIRDIAPRSRTAVGKYCSRKAGRLLAHRSRGHGVVGGEKLAIMRQEIDPDVADLRTYHARFDVIEQSAIHSYFPSILTLHWSGEISAIFVEGDGQQYGPRTRRALTELCDTLAWRLQILGDHDVAPTTQVRKNIVAIQSERYAVLSAARVIPVLDRLRESGGECRVDSLEHVDDCDEALLPLLRALICRGLITASLEERFGPATRIRLAEHSSTRGNR